MPSSKIIVLRSSDGETFEVDEEVAMESQTIKKIIEDVRANTGAFYRFWARLKLLKARRSPTNLLWCCSQQQKSTEKSLDPLFAENNIHLPYVTGRILWKVIEYCTKHVETPESDDKSAEDDLTSFNADFVKVDIGTLLHLMAAANYLNIESLLDLTCQAAADHMIINKTPEEIRKPFNIKNEFIHDEKDEVL